MICSYFLLAFLLIHNCNAQISFIGFDQDQCGLINEHGYTFENFSLGSHGSGYIIYRDGNKVYEKSIEFGVCSVFNLKFINQTTGFIIQRHTNGFAIYKTIDSGLTWNYFGGGAPTFLGFYLVNQNTGYLITYWDNPKSIYIDRSSDINPSFMTDRNIINDVLIEDTIFGDPFCEMNYLSFKIKNDNDTVNYKINFNKEVLNVYDNLTLNKIKIFPNPICDFFQIETDMIITKDFNIKVYNNLGSIIKLIKYTATNRLYIGDLVPGIYFIEISNTDKRQICKIIKK